MKNILFVLASFSFFLSCSSSDNKTSVVANTSTEFTIAGMTCPHGCAAPIENKLSRMEGVASAKVDFDTKTAIVTFDSKITNFEAFKAKIEELNNHQYSVEKKSEEAVSSASVNVSSSNKEKEKMNSFWNTDFELPNILDFFTNIV